MFCSCTTLEIPFVPLADPATLLDRASGLEVAQVTEARFGRDAIDAAILKILSQGERAETLGIRRLSDAEAAAHPDPAAVAVLRLPVDLKNFAGEFPDYAAQYYGTPGDMPVIEGIVHAICHGELDAHGEVHVSEDAQHPPSRHEETERRGKIEAAFEAQGRGRAAA